MFRESRIWGVIPPGFQNITEVPGRLLVVRDDRAGEIASAICGSACVAVAPSHHIGRAPLKEIRFNDGDAALVRDYRHGGIFRHFTGDWFFTWPPRPFRELALTEELRRRGLPTVEVYAAVVERLWGPLYRGCLITRELRGARDLWAVLRDHGGANTGLDPVLQATARALRTMHRQGVFHSDLNLKNILIRSQGGVVEAYLIDFDKAKLFLGELPAPLISRNLKRLLRSALKLDPERRYLTAASWRRLREFYEGGV